MKRNFWIKELPIALFVSGLVVATAAWQNLPAKPKQNKTDTIPDRNKKIRDIDEALEELEKSKEEVNRSLNEIDFGKIEKEIREATEQIHLDAEKMKAEINRTIKEVDAAKIQAEVQSAMKEVQRSLKEVDAEKIRAEMEESLAKVDWDKMHKEIEKVKSTDFKKIEEDLQKMKPEIEKSMKEAHKSIEKAKKELTEYKNFIDGLDKDGLINKKEQYTIEYKRGELTINGKKQPAEVVNKFSSFLKGRKDFTIKKDENNFNIHNEN